MNASILQGIRMAFCLPVWLAAFTAFAQSQDSTSSEVDGSTLQRILQYESVLGSELSTKVGICIDDALNKAWIIDEDLTKEIKPSVLSNLRRASETCAITTSSQRTRLAAQLREMTERQLRLAMKLDQPVTASRNCLKTTGTSETHKACIATAIGKLPTENEWGYWTLLIRRANLQQGKP